MIACKEDFPFKSVLHLVMVEKKHTQTQMLTLVDPTAGVNLQPNGLIDDLRTISRPFRSIGIFMDDCYQGAMVQLRTALLHFFGSQCV